MVVTLGKEGSSLRHRGAERVVPVDPVPVVDPTGAGDAFAATYLLARLAGIEPERRLAAANLSGALAVGAVGARGRLATLGDLIGPAAPGRRPAACHPAIGGTGSAHREKPRRPASGSGPARTGGGASSERASARSRRRPWDAARPSGSRWSGPSRSRW